MFEGLTAILLHVKMHATPTLDLGWYWELYDKLRYLNCIIEEVATIGTPLECTHCR